MSGRVLDPAAPLVEAIRAIEASRRRIAVVLERDGRLVGTLTDGDVRRCLLAGGSLETPVKQAMNTRPLSAPVGSPDGYLLDLMRRRNVLAVPLVDEAGRFARIVHLTDLAPTNDAGDARGFAFAVIMAGGEGMRLRPLTERIPKPMVDIGGVPLLERQIQRLAKAGLRRVYLSVNYLGHVIEQHFGDGRDFGLDIRYLREDRKLGTAGALTLLPERPTAPILVINGDIVTDSDFGSLLAFHLQHEAEVTVAAVDYRIEIPYGVIRSEGPRVTSLHEKPSQRFLCNAGIYAIAPAVLELLRPRAVINMTDLIEVALASGRPVSVFPVHEYWTDIGTPAELEQARRLFATGRNPS
ncbi:MAG: nucleotidyltransferase family protein [Armatimonadota bacterium]|nr:MAG: nucleotidyltransferase family protein [Armatimonadota bacterium]